MLQIKHTWPDDRVYDKSVHTKTQMQLVQEVTHMYNTSQQTHTEHFWKRY